MKSQKIFKLATTLTIIAIFIGNIGIAQVDTNFYEFRNYYFQDYEGELDTTESGPITSFRKYEYMVGPRLSPSGSFEIAGDVIEDWISDYLLNGKDQSNLNSEWTALGPHNTPIASGDTKGTGRIICITIDTTGRDDKLMVGSPFGGAWSSDDDGDNWSNMNTDFLPIIKISDIAYNPANPDIIFVATGDRDDYRNASVSAGIFRTTNGGQTWSPVNSGLNIPIFYQISKILIDPNNTNIAYVATSNGIYKTTSANTTCTWTALTDNLVYQKYFRNIGFKEDGNFNTIFATGKDIIQTTNGGNSWNSLTGFGTGLDFSDTFFDDYPNVIRINFATSPDAPNKIFATAIMSDDEDPLTWKSTRKHFIFIYSGTSWTIKDPLGINGNYEQYGAGPSWLSIAVSPTDADLIFFGNVIIWRSTDGGDNFNYITGYNGAVHCDQHDLKFSDDGEKLYIANDGGFYVLSNPDFTTTGNFTQKNNGLTVGTIQKIGIAQDFNDLALTGNFDCSSFLYDPETYADGWKHFTGGDGCEHLVDYSNNDTMYASSQKNTNLLKSFTGGVSFPFLVLS